MSGIDDQIRAHLPLVRDVATTFYRRGHRFDDAYADALLGLWEAIEKWDGTGRFEGYAAGYMHRRIIDGWRKDTGHRFYRPQFVELTDQDRSPDDPFEDVIEKVDNESKVRQVLATIPRQKPRDQQVIRDRIKGRDFKDIAADHSLSERRAGQIWQKWTAELRSAA